MVMQMLHWSQLKKATLFRRTTLNIAVYSLMHMMFVNILKTKLYLKKKKKKLVTQTLQIWFQLHSKINCWDYTITVLHLRVCSPLLLQDFSCISINDESYFDFTSLDLHFSHQTCFTPARLLAFICFSFFLTHLIDFMSDHVKDAVLHLLHALTLNPLVLSLH